MSDTDRVLRPLDEAAAAIEMLESYESPAALQEALRATWHAVEQSLRRLLRSDVTAPDDIRMTALSPAQMPMATVLTELRRRDLISLRLAGRIHELQQALGRGSGLRPGDADSAARLVETLRAEVAQRAENASRSPIAPRVPADTLPVAMDSPTAAPARAQTATGPSAGPRRPLYVMAGVAVALAVVAVAIVLFGGETDLERGIDAFADGRHDVAEQYFRAALYGDDGSVTARLYLARILRGQGHNREAADLLGAAARLAPEDAAVRRELGYLFVELDRTSAAIEQFQHAVELEPDEPLNWVGLIQALRLAGDPAADEWHRRAPAEARAILETR